MRTVTRIKKVVLQRVRRAQELPTSRMEQVDNLVRQRLISWCEHFRVWLVSQLPAHRMLNLVIGREISRKVKPNLSDYRNRRAFVDLFGRGSS